MHSGHVFSAKGDILPVQAHVSGSLRTVSRLRIERTAFEILILVFESNPSDQCHDTHRHRLFHDSLPLFIANPLYCGIYRSQVRNTASRKDVVKAERRHHHHIFAGVLDQLFTAVDRGN